MRLKITITILAFMLSGCSWLFPYESDFQCNVPNNGVCGDSLEVLGSLEPQTEPIYHKNSSRITDVNNSDSVAKALYRVVRTNREEIENLNLQIEHIKKLYLSAITAKNITEETAVDQQITNIALHHASQNGNGVFSDEQCTERDQLCYVFTYYANVRENPSLDSKTVAVLTFRDVMHIRGYENGFFKLDNGYVKAWILRKFSKDER